jgi:hypothetical protein
MNTEDGARVPASETNKIERKPESATAVAARPSSTPRIVGAVVVLLLLGAAAYYFVDRHPGTDVAMRPSPESPPAATTTTPAPKTAQTPAPSAAPAPSTPTPQQQTAAPGSDAMPAPEPRAATPAPEPRVAAPAPESQPSQPATTAQEPANAPPPADSKQSTQSAEATPKSEEPSTQASTPAAPQPSMRDQPAALPDQAAATPPKNETMLVVMRGPANIRSAPGKGGRVIGTAAKDTAVKELSRSGKWVQVETESGTGWIAAALLGPQPSASR